MAPNELVIHQKVGAHAVKDRNLVTDKDGADAG
jgi:hypothetical protein